ncbi:MAG: hypothetical protein R3D34_16685 [Nitratireductor sp.]
MFSTVAFAADDRVDLTTALPEPSARAGVSDYAVGEEIKDIITIHPDIERFDVIGCKDINTWCYSEFEMPAGILDVEGGRVRLIMQHELNGADEVRMVDLHIACEWTNGSYGANGRLNGRFCWVRQVGGGEYSFILGDNVGHNLFTPWNWVIATDYKYLDGGGILGGNKIRIYAHPHVTARVFFFD